MDFRTATHAGYTLLELITTLLIASILMGAAVPDFMSMLERNRISLSVNTFVGHLQFARSEAIKRNSFVILCPSSDGLSCIRDYTKWANGYITFVDNNRNKLREGDEVLLNVHQGETNKINIYSSSNYRKIVGYYPNGLSRGLNTTIRFCGKQFEHNNRTIIISNTGRPRLSKVLANGKKTECS